MDESGRAGIETLMLEQLQRPSVILGFCFGFGGEWQWVEFVVACCCGCALRLTASVAGSLWGADEGYLVAGNAPWRWE